MTQDFEPIPIDEPVHRIRKVFTYVFCSPEDVMKKRAVLERLNAQLPECIETMFADKLLEGIQNSGGILPYDYMVDNYGFNHTITRNDPVPTYAEVMDHIKLAGQEARRSRVASDLMEISGDLGKVSDDEIRERIRETSSKLTVHTDFKPQPTGKEIYEQRREQSIGMLTGISETIDRMIFGLEKGTLLTVLGFVGSFKTMTCLNIMYNNVVGTGHNMAFFTLEVPRDLLIFQLLSRHSYHPKWREKGFGNVPTNDIRKGQLTPEQEDFIFNMVEPDLLNNPEHGKFYIFEENDVDGYDKVHFEQKLASFPVKIDGLIIDYIQLFEYLPHEPSVARLKCPTDYYVRQISELAKDCNGHRINLIVAAQSNRDGYRRAVEQEGMFDLLALSDSHELERSSYYVLSCYADEARRNDNQMITALLKNRGGPISDSTVTVPAHPEFSMVGHDLQEYVGNSPDLSHMMFSVEP